MTFSSVHEIASAGFVGFQTVADLRSSPLGSVPEEPGVYVILRPATSPPEFLEQSPAGWFKGRDPSVPVERLRKSWVPGTPVLYMGKAGGRQTKTGLRTRLRAYLRHGAGRRAAHWGGRFIWQLAGSDGLVVAWKRTSPREPREVEAELIREFTATYGARPFANRTA